MKLLFTMWVAFHLFCFGVFHKNLKKLEVLYVVTSLLVPAVIACVPLTTNTYALSGWCYLKQNTTVEIIEKVVLWDAPATIILLAASAAMVAMAIKLRRRAMMYEGDQYRKALKQLLPLVAFPILFFVFMIPQMVLDIYTYSPSNSSFEIVLVVSITLWSISSGVTYICRKMLV